MAPELRCRILGDTDNIAADFLASAAARPDHTCVIGPDGTKVSYAEVHQLARAVADALDRAGGPFPIL